jgi:uncharacterized protein (DUF1800 family)
MTPQPLPPLSKLDPAEAWKPWTPSADDPWSLKWAGHLYRRAAFGATWSELQTAVKAGPDATLRKLFTPGPQQVQFDEVMDKLAPDPTQYQPGNPNGDSLQGWWLYRMIATRFPLQERLALFWHNHFATSVAKVQQIALMQNQNILIRKHALGKFGPFVLAMSQDPAMLIWLDSNSNVRGRPNENYARELMELFTLGVGHYTEADVGAAARAFTGWHTDGKTFTFSSFQHDSGTKTFLGRTGAWDGGDIVRIILEQPAAARFLVRKLYRHFISEEEVPPDALLEPLAERFRRSDYDIADLMKTLLRSRLFFSAYAYRRRIKSPAEFVVGLLRSLEGKMQVESAMPALAQALEGQGQQLFAPPTVKGWDGGKAWLNSATLLARDNTAWRFVQGGQGPLGVTVNPVALVSRYAGKDDVAKQVGFLLDLFLQPAPGEVAEAARHKLTEFLMRDQPHGGARERRLRETAHAILLMPMYQLA